MKLMIEMAVTVSVKVGLSGILSNELKQLKTIKIFVYFYRMSVVWGDFSLEITPATDVKSPLIRKNRLPAIHHIHPMLASSALFWKNAHNAIKSVTSDYWRSPSGTFSTQISHTKLKTYPSNLKISPAELGTSPPFVPVKERPLAMALRMSPCTYVIHRGCTSPRFSLPAIDGPCSTIKPIRL